MLMPSPVDAQTLPFASQRIPSGTPFPSRICTPINIPFAGTSSRTVSREQGFHCLQFNLVQSEQLHVCS